MRIDLKEKNHFLTVFEAFFDQSINRPINGISIDSRNIKKNDLFIAIKGCLLYTSPSPRDLSTSRMPSST